MNRVTVEVPATTANLGPGFDSLGLAIDLWNRFDIEIDGRRVASLDDVKSVEVMCDGEGAGDLSVDESNLVYRAFARALQGETFPERVRLWVKNQVPLSSGLGSSATAIVGGLVAGNAFRHSPLSKDKLLEMATEFEGHPDNVAPALFGGLAVSAVTEDGGVTCISVRPPDELWVCVAVPDFYLSTKDTRAQLPQRVSRQDAVFNLSRAALWVAAAANGELSALRIATEDTLHEPYRQELIPGLDGVFEAALGADAYGVALSGSGPSVAAFCSKEKGEEIGDAMRQAFRKVGVTARIYLRRPAQGTKVIPGGAKDNAGVNTA